MRAILEANSKPNAHFDILFNHRLTSNCDYSNFNYGKAIAMQVHPKDEDTIVVAQQPVKPMRAPSTRHKGTARRMPTLRENGAGEQDWDDDDLTATGTPCVTGEFRSALNTLFNTLGETQNWYVFCINLNDSQLPNQPGGRSVKGQVRSFGLTEIAKRNVNVFEVGMTPKEFCQRYRPGTPSCIQRIFQRTGLYEDEYEEAKSFRSDDFHNSTRLTSNRDDLRRLTSRLNARDPVIAVSVTQMVIMHFLNKVSILMEIWRMA